MSLADARIAIIGMACVFPKAGDLRGLWENILAGVNAIGDPPPTWGGHAQYDATGVDPERLYTHQGGYLGDLARFDPLRFGVMPRSIDGGEPEHFIALRLAHDALADAGYVDREFERERTEVILGRGTYANRGFVTVLQHTFAVDQFLDLLRKLHPEHTDAEIAELRSALKRQLPPFNAETAPSLPHSVMCGRVANRLDLMGPAYAVDAACASALIAVESGMKDLRAGHCDLVLAGGVQISTTYPIALLFSQLGALSRSGQLRPFHPEADGTLLGEGAGMVVLKRLEDAERDGDRVYAIVRGVGTSSDGRAVGLLAPRLEGEVLALRRAYERAGVAPESIGLIEAHGTGTPVGDANEIEALRRVFGSGVAHRPSCALGSIKSMIGHCIPASGAAGLIKGALSVFHRVLPPTLHSVEPNPLLERTPFWLVPEARPWVHGRSEPRRAGVSAFGFGGINAHAVLEEYRPSRAGRSVVVPHNVHRRRASELCLVAAPNRAELAARCERLARVVERRPALDLADLAFTLNTPGPARGELRVAFVAQDLSDLRRKLEYATGRLRDPQCARIQEIQGVFFFEERLAEQGRLAFVFPGEGAQYDHMLADLCLHFEEVRTWFDLMDRAFAEHHRGFVPSEVVFPPPGTRRDLWAMDSAIEAVFAANQAMHALLGRLGLRPDAVVGHSTGEYSALLAAGAAEVGDEARLIDLILDGNQVTERARARGIVPSGVLLAVGPALPELIRGLVDDPQAGIYLAMDNCPHQAVLCGTEEAMARAQARLAQEGAVCQRLPFDRAYHTPLFAAVSEELREFFERASFRTPAVALYSCVTADRVPDDPAEIRRLALAQWSSPVRFRETVEKMYADGVRLFVEVGPRANLTSFVRDILRDRPHLSVASNTARRPAMTQLHAALGLLAAHGVELTLEPLYERRGCVRLDRQALLAGEAPEETVQHLAPLALELPVLDLPEAEIARFRRGTVDFGDTRFSRTKIERVPKVDRPPAASRAAAMSAYMRTMEQFLATQEQVLQQVLARPAAAPAAPAVSSPSAPERHPFVGADVRRNAAGGWVVRREVGPAEERFLLDHTLGGRISDDPALRALSVFPLAMSLEMMAEAAALGTDAAPVGLRDVRVRRWLGFDRESLTLEIDCAPGAQADEIAVRLFEIGEATRELALEGIVLVSGVRSATGLNVTPLLTPRTSRFAPDRLYAEGAVHGMFHGPAFRGVARIDAVGPGGIDGTLRGVASDRLFASVVRPEFALDPLVVDAASQLIGYWTAETLERDFVVFPVGFERLEQWGAPLAPGEAAQCAVRCRPDGDRHVVADLEVTRASGAPLLRISGWRVHRVALPERVYAYRLAPCDRMLAQAHVPPIPTMPGVQFCRLELPDGFLEIDGAIWRDSLAWLSLGRAERERWAEMRGQERRRAEWLLGRLAAKDAVRLWLLARHGLKVWPADVEIGSDGAGRPFVSGPWLERLGGRAPAVSVAHSAGVAVAVAGDVEGARGLGLDLESLDRPVPDLELAAFSEAERELLQSVAPALRDEWVRRMWCAKEALGKALGTGLAGDPRHLAVRKIDLDSGAIDIEGHVPSVWTAREGSWIWAFSLYI